MSVEIELQNSSDPEPKAESTKTEYDKSTDNEQQDNTSESSEPKQSPHAGFLGLVDNYFGVSRSGSSFRVESIAGVTSFVAMVYIYMVNAGMFSEGWVGVTYEGAYIATGIPSIVGTLLMAFLANMPLAMAPGMGVNAFIVYSLLLSGKGLTYANCLVFVLLDGIIFVLLTTTGLRQKIFESIPGPVKTAVTVGIGLFIAFIGFQQSCIIVNDDSTLVSFVSFNVLTKGTHFVTYNVVSNTVGGMLPAYVAFVGVLTIGILSHRGVKGEILIGIGCATVLFYILMGISAAAGEQGAKDYFNSIDFTNPFKGFGDWGKDCIARVFYKGFDFKGYSDNAGSLVLDIFTTALSLCMIDMFDTIGTLYGACSKGDLLDENGTPIRMNRMMLSDAIATIVGAFCGTSTVTTFVESSSGVSVGGRTGFTAVITATCFFICLFLSPIAKLIPRSATAAALIWVGVLMMTSIAKIQWHIPADAIVAFITITIMAFGYSISTGIGMGIIFFVVVHCFIGDFKGISIPTWIIGILFLATFLLTN